MHISACGRWQSGWTSVWGGHWVSRRLAEGDGQHFLLLSTCQPGAGLWMFIQFKGPSLRKKYKIAHSKLGLNMNTYLE